MSQTGEINGEADDALSESEVSYKDLFEEAPIAYWSVGSDGLIRSANRRASVLLGYPAAKMIGWPVFKLYADTPEGIGRAEEMFQRFKSGEEIRDFEIQFQGAHGRRVWGSLSVDPILDKEGRVVASRSMVVDITDRMRAEAAGRELAVLEERGRLARELHDSIAQGLTGIIWQLNVLVRSSHVQGSDTSSSLRQVRELARETLREVRRSVWDLGTGPLGGRPLIEALRQATEKIIGDDPVNISVDVIGDQRVLPAGIETALLRICQESLTNIVKYAQASEVTVTVDYGDAAVRLAIDDNGVGFDPSHGQERREGTGGFGHISMKERARVLGGDLTVRSSPGHGTLVETTLPLR